MSESSARILRSIAFAKMASYVPNYKKKQEALRHKEAALLRLIEQGAALEKLLLSAASIREARIRVLKAKQATIPCIGGPEEAEISRLEEKIKAIRGLSLDNILAEHGFRGEEDMESK